MVNCHGCGSALGTAILALVVVTYEHIFARAGCKAKAFDHSYIALQPDNAGQGVFAANSPDSFFMFCDDFRFRGKQEADCPLPADKQQRLISCI
jgi:hypothetical protein